DGAPAPQHIEHGGPEKRDGLVVRHAYARGEGGNDEQPLVLGMLVPERDEEEDRGPNEVVERKDLGDERPRPEERLSRERRRGDDARRDAPGEPIRCRV